jgi:hypothetical protein
VGALCRKKGRPLGCYTEGARVLGQEEQALGTLPHHLHAEVPMRGSALCSTMAPSCIFLALHSSDWCMDPSILSPLPSPLQGPGPSEPPA